jgi:hypothetical protein
MNQKYFCTLFDSNYLLKGVVMLRTLREQCPGAHVFVLCMDDATYQILPQLQLPHITRIKLSDFEDDTLLALKKQRSIAEYCWTLSPCLPWFVLENNPQVDQITYVDADLCFYSSVEPIFDEIGDRSIAIIEHRFTKRLQHLEVNGRFCVEWVSIRRDEEGMACLSRWRDQCIEWCFYRLEDTRMGDQKYLDEWPQRYQSLVILQHVGAGLAPWNYSKYSFETGPNGHLQVDGQPVIFYHFHQFQLLDNGAFDRLSTFYTSECPEPSDIYSCYEVQLKQALGDVRVFAPEFKSGLKPASHVAGRRWVHKYLPRWLKDAIRRIARVS